MNLHLFLYFNVVLWIFSLNCSLIVNISLFLRLTFLYNINEVCKQIEIQKNELFLYICKTKDNKVLKLENLKNGNGYLLRWGPK